MAGGVTNGSVKMMPDDGDSLLDQFLTDRSERAFRGLVQRYLPLVHAVAFRSLRDAELAKEVSQQVFIRLAASAGSIRHECGLVAWLHRTAHSLAVDAVRREQRRKLREQKAAAMSSLSSPAFFSETAWESLAPVLDELLNRLPENDRRVILLRYYENRPLAAVAASLGIQEKAAAKRAIRALEKLRALFAKQGIATSSSALAALLPLHAAPALPSGVAAAVSASAFPFSTVSPGLFSSLLSLSPVMKTWSGFAALLLLGLGLYIRFSPTIGGSTAASPPAASGLATSATTAARPARARGEPSSVSQLDDVAKIGNLFERSRALESILSVLPKASFPEAARKLASLHFDFGGREMKLLISHWCELDAPGAYAFSTGEDGLPGLLPPVIDEWAKKDFDAAFAKAMSIPSPYLQNQVLQDMILPLTGDDPSRAIVSLGECLPSLRSDVCTTIAGEILDRNPGSLRKLAENLPGQVSRDKLLECFATVIASRTGETPPEVAPTQGIAYDVPSRPIALDDRVFVAEWVAANPEEAQKCPALNCEKLFQSLARADREQALRIAGEIPDSAARLRERIQQAAGLSDHAFGVSPDH